MEREKPQGASVCSKKKEVACMTYSGSGGLCALHCGKSARFCEVPARYTTKEKPNTCQDKKQMPVYILYYVLPVMHIRRV
jgi:hypothetical protein